MMISFNSRPVRLPLIRIIVPVGVLSSTLTATTPCAESFCLLLRDREGLFGLGWGSAFFKKPYAVKA